MSLPKPAKTSIAPELPQASTVTRAQLSEAVHRATGLPRSDGANHVETVLELIGSTLVKGEPVLLSGFGKFVVLSRAARKGRNVKLGVDVPIAPRLAIVFKPAPGLLARLNRPKPDTSTLELVSSSEG